MALEGTIKDFGLPDIFQLIGMQRKTGVLTLKSPAETVTVTFESGQVVNADSSAKRVDERIGMLLVKQRKLSEDQLEEVLNRQKKTLQRVGHILIAGQYVSPGDLKQALQVQVSQLVFKLFRWREGDYHFEQTDKVQYDREHFDPMSADFILMEGIRMVDEWPMIERKIPSTEMVFRKVVDSSQISLGADDELDMSALAGGGPAASGISLSESENRIYALVDGQRTVQEIIDTTGVGDFDVCRTLFDLLSRDLVAPAGRQATATGTARLQSRPPKAASALPGYAVLVAVLFAAVVGLTVHRGAPFAVLGFGSLLRPLANGAVHSAARSRLERVDRALQAHRALRGSLPGELAGLVEAGLVEASQVIDPWDRPLEYGALGDGYVISTLDAAGEPLPGGRIERRWSGDDPQS